MTFSELGLFLQIYFSVVAFVLGTVFGSFLNCAAWRIAHHMSFVKGRSICPKCKHVLSAVDLIPIVSFFMTRGRCRYCGDKISARYPLTELILGTLTVLTFIHGGLTPLFIRDFAFICCLFCLSLVDLEIYEIPNGTLLISLVAWVLYLPFSGYDLRQVLLHLLAGAVYLVGFLLLSLLMDRILKRDSLGGGDIKLMGVAGLYFGLVGTLFMMIMACFTGLVVACIHNREKGKSLPIPFGPFLSVACVCMLLAGEPLVNWYLGLLS